MWVRSGECCRCGECCRGDPFNGENGPPLVEGYCPLYRQDSEQGHCTGYGTHPYYLGGCKVWPQHPGQIADKPSCTYRFDWVEDGG